MKPRDLELIQVAVLHAKHAIDDNVRHSHHTHLGHSGVTSNNSTTSNNSGIR